MTETMTNEDFTQIELKRLRDHEIPYEYKLFGSKYLAKVKLIGGKIALVCPYRRTVKIGRNTYKYKYLERFLEKNGLEVAQ